MMTKLPANEYSSRQTREEQYEEEDSPRQTCCQKYLGCRILAAINRASSKPGRTLLLEYYITTSPESSELMPLNNRYIKRVEHLKYLGSHVIDSPKGFNIRKTIAWHACNKLHKVWRSNLPPSLKVPTFRTLIEPVLLYE